MVSTMVAIPHTEAMAGDMEVVGAMVVTAEGEVAMEGTEAMQEEDTRDTVAMVGREEEEEEVRWYS